MNVAQVAQEVREELEVLSDEKLVEILKESGMVYKSLSREQMLQSLVDAEVYAFTH